MSDSLFLCCRVLGCTMCAGDPDCPSVKAYREKYGDIVADAARGDIDVWFPRSVAPGENAPAGVVAPGEKSGGADAALASLRKTHDRLAGSGWDAARKTEAKAKARRARPPAWVRKINRAREEDL